MTKQIRQIFAKMQEIDQSQLNLETDLVGIRNDLRTRATLTRLEQVEISLGDFATKSDFAKVLGKLEAYTTLESFNKMRIA